MDCRQNPAPKDLSSATLAASAAALLLSSQSAAAATGSTGIPGIVMVLLLIGGALVLLNIRPRRQGRESLKKHQDARLPPVTSRRPRSHVADYSEALNKQRLR